MPISGIAFLEDGRIPASALPETGTQGPSFLDIYKVGQIFISTDSISPQVHFGGTWIARGGYVLVGYLQGDPDFGVPGDTIGAKTHTLSVAEMPAHTHVQDSHNHTQNPHNHGIDEGTTDGSGTFMDRSNAAAATTAATNNATAINLPVTAINQNTGDGEAHNNIQPSLVVYMWERIA